MLKETISLDNILHFDPFFHLILKFPVWHACFYTIALISSPVQIPLNPSVSIQLNVWKLSPLHILIFGSELLTIRFPTDLNVLQFIMWPLAIMSLLWMISN